MKSKQFDPQVEEALGGFAERLEAALGGRSGKSFAKNVGLSASGFAQYLNGGTLPNLRHLVYLAKALDVRVGWLAEGEGQMRGGPVLELPELPEPPASPDKEPEPPQLFKPDAGLMQEAIRHVNEMEARSGKKFGDQARARAMAAVYNAIIEARATKTPGAPTARQSASRSLKPRSS